MKKTIKQLEKDLANMTAERDKFWGRYNELDQEKRRNENNQKFAVQQENDELKYQVRNLLEIIRWQVNPETAKSPFIPTKDQRDERKGMY